jgi:predicted DNA-binding protein (MmcQ/YjbR family)
MNLEDLQSICNELDDVTEDIKWGQDLCFNIGGKMFLVTNTESKPVSASFKTNEETFNELIEREGFKPAPYLAKHKWVYVDDINRLSKKEWQQFIGKSYELVKAKLPKKRK